MTRKRASLLARACIDISRTFGRKSCISGNEEWIYSDGVAPYNLLICDMDTYVSVRAFVPRLGRRIEVFTYGIYSGNYTMSPGGHLERIHALYVMVQAEKLRRYIEGTEGHKEQFIWRLP